MDWFYPKRRGPEWKHGWTNQTISSMSAPPFHLLAVFVIVVVLLWLSQSTGYSAQMQRNSANFQVLLLLLPLFLLLFMASYSTNWWANFQARRGVPQREASMVSMGSGDTPWGVALFVVLLLVLLWYQSSFHSKWFGPLRSLD